MNDRSTDWVQEGRGTAMLSTRWSVDVETRLVAFSTARETGQTLAANDTGSLFLFDRNGQMLAATRSGSQVRLLQLCDTGVIGVAASDDCQLTCLNSSLKEVWTRELPDHPLALAVTPYGTHFAVSLQNAKTAIVSANRRKTAEFETVRPLSHLQFLHTTPELIAAAENGLFGRYNFNGDPVWTVRHWTNVGDLAATGDGGAVVLAGFNHGVQVFEGTGNSLGTLVVDGTPSRLAMTYTPRRIVASTMERQLFGLEEDGKVAWLTYTPDDVIGLEMGPLGDWLIVGLANGQLVRLDWS